MYEVGHVNRVEFSGLDKISEKKNVLYKSSVIERTVIENQAP